MSDKDPGLSRAGHSADIDRDARPAPQTAGQALPPDAHQVTLSRVFHDFGERWQIQHQLSPECWTAVRRPEPSQVIVKVAHDLDALRAKMTGAEAELAESE